MRDNLVYICCVEEDESIAEEIASVLSRYHIDTYIGLRSADNNERMRMLDSMRILVLLFSRGVLQSTIIDNEVTEALNRRLPIIPFQIDDTSVKENLSMDFMLKKCQWALGYPDRTRQMDDLVVSICRFVGIDAIQRNPQDPFEQLKRGIALEHASNGLHKDRKEAMLWITKSADSGNLMAMFELYKFYRDTENDNPYRDYDKARKWLIKAADNGLAEAQYILGTNYEVYDDSLVAIVSCLPQTVSIPLGIKRNLKKAREYYTRSAQQGNKKAMFRLGVLCMEGPKGMRNDEEAFKYLSMASDIDHPVLWLHLGKLYEKRKDRAKAMECFAKAGHIGDFDIVKALMHGRISKNNLDKVHDIVFKSVHAYDPRFRELRATLYERGLSVEKDTQKAAEYYNEAFDMFTSDISGNKNDVAGIRCLKKAIKLGDLRALYSLARYYFDHQTRKDAFYYFTEAAAKGLPIAQFYLAYYFMFGLDVAAIDYNQAIRWLRKADVPGIPEAPYYLGELYLKGKGCEPSPSWAFFYWEKAAMQNYPAAEFRLSQSYEIGYGTEKDTQRAQYWREKAIKHGFHINGD